jgi:hypothetical protein
MKIIYPLEVGIAVIHPVGDLPILEIARKDVPAGLPYMIVEDSTIPTDRNTRADWTADFSTPDGYGIGHEAWAIEQQA